MLTNVGTCFSDHLINAGLQEMSKETETISQQLEFHCEVLLSFYCQKAAGTDVRYLLMTFPATEQGQACCIFQLQCLRNPLHPCHLVRL